MIFAFGGGERLDQVGNQDNSPDGQAEIKQTKEFTSLANLR